MKISSVSTDTDMTTVRKFEAMFDEFDVTLSVLFLIVLTNDSLVS